MHRRMFPLLGLGLAVIVSTASGAETPAALLLPIARGGSGPMPRVTGTQTPTTTASCTRTPTATATCTRTTTPTPEATATLTNTSAPTNTPTITATPTQTSTPTVTSTPSRTTIPVGTSTATVLEDLLLNGDFEEGAVYWAETSNGVGVELIQEGVGRWGDWGAKLGGRFYSQDAIAQTVHIPADAQLAFVAFSVKMTTLETSTEPHSILVLALYGSDSSFLTLLGQYDNTDTAYLWTRQFSGDLAPYRGQAVIVLAGAQTEGMTTFYLDDITFVVERPGG